MSTVIAETNNGKMLDLIVYMNSFSEYKTSYKCFRESILSIERSIDDKNLYKYYFVVDNSQEKVIIDLLHENKLNKYNILNMKISNKSWAEEYNLFHENYVKLDKSKFILFSHDDLTIDTKNFFTYTLNLINNHIDKIGWITYTSDFYYKKKNDIRPNTCRQGFFKDQHLYPYMFECHKFSNNRKCNIKSNLHLLDYPQKDKLTLIHAPFSHFNLISTQSMKKVGLCSEWHKYTLLIDEDWGLEALKNNLYNIWISDVTYTHPTSDTVRNRLDVKGAHQGFIKKWGFDHKAYSVQEVIELKNDSLYKNTLMFWSSNYNSYEYQYL